MSDPYEGGNFGGGKKRTKADGPPESYAEVKERIQVFYAHYPTGRLVTGDIRIFESEPGEVVRVMVQAKAYRTPEDEMPGIGTSWMVVPGKTPYTNGSELENCETSAWGRALAAIGILVDKGIASAQEIRSKQTEDHEPPSKPTAPATALAEAAAKAVKEVREGLNKSDLTEAPKTAPEPAKEPKTPKGAATPAPVKEDATESVGDEAAMLDAAIAAADAGGGPADVIAAAMKAGGADVIAAAMKAGEADPETGEIPTADDGPSGLSYDEFKRMAREKFIPNGEIQRVARELIEKGAISQTGGVKDLSDEERLTLFLTIIAGQD